MLTAEEILGANDATIETVDVPEWGGQVCIRDMTGEARDEWESSLVPDGKSKRINYKNIRARLVAACCCDKDGNLLFTALQVSELGKKSGKALDKVFEACKRLNGLSDSDVEELAKN